MKVVRGTANASFRKKKKKKYESVAKRALLKKGYMRPSRVPTENPPLNELLDNEQRSISWFSSLRASGSPCIVSVFKLADHYNYECGAEDEGKVYDLFDDRRDSLDKVIHRNEELKGKYK